MPNGVEYLIDPQTGKVVLTTTGGTVSSPIVRGAADVARGGGLGSFFDPVSFAVSQFLGIAGPSTFEGGNRLLYGPYRPPGSYIPESNPTASGSAEEQRSWVEEMLSMGQIPPGFDVEQLPNGNWKVNDVEIESGNPVIRGADMGTPGIVQTTHNPNAGGGGGGSDAGGSPEGWIYPNEKMPTADDVIEDTHTNPDNSTVVIYKSGAEQWGKAPEDFSEWETPTETAGTGNSDIDLNVILNNNGEQVGNSPVTTGAADTPGTGTGTGTGNGAGSGSGTGNGSGTGEGNGNGDGTGDGDGSDEDLMALLQQNGPSKTQVKGPEGADIPYVYDWESIFANPIQEAYYTSPYAIERGMGQRELLELIASMRR